MTRHPVEAQVDVHRDDRERGPGVEREAFKEALSHWASTVTVVAARDGDDVHATTATSFFSVSLTPPLVAVSLGAGAQVLPWLDLGARFTVSFLAEGQRDVAVRFADSFPVGPSPWSDQGDPVVRGAVGAVVCTVREVVPTEGGARLVVGRVDDVVPGTGGRPLLYHRRGYRRMAAEE